MDTKTIQNLLSMNLFERLGIEHLSPEEQILFVEKMGEAVQGRIMLRVLKELSTEQKEIIESKLSDSSNFDSLLLLISKMLPNYEQIINEEIATYKQEVISRYTQE